MQMLLSDRVAIITGSARGVGKAIATKFAEEGCSVVIADILADRAKQTAAEISGKGKEALAVECDHTSSIQVQEMVDKVIKKFGRIDILVNNAGAGGGRGWSTEEEWHRTININLTGPYLCSKYVVPHMKERKSGSIIHFSSIAAIRPNSLAIAYASAKAGVLGLMYSMALELAPFNIRVNAILPDMVRTEFFAGMPPEQREAYFQMHGKTFLMGRVAVPEDFMGVALFLASDLSSYITGIQIFVGGKYPEGSAPK
jgi:NAD(P)-dependent dehydrogenase (short-subunit alcohol dehydrogenase family)